jgi:hypothetical protein
VCRGLYQNNVTLRTKHQELLARLPTTTTRSTVSPEYHFEPHSRTSSLCIATSALGLIRSPRPSLYRTHTRKVTIASADISHLADQKVELLDRLEKLEAEATSADTSMGSLQAKRSLPSHCSQQRLGVLLSAIPQRHLQGLVTRQLHRHLETRRTKTRSPLRPHSLDDADCVCQQYDALAIWQ